jgi:hypothetical protein
MGNKGTLRAGDCQWMTAASGIEHNEGTGHPGGACARLCVFDTRTVGRGARALRGWLVGHAVVL